MPLTPSHKTGLFFGSFNPIHTGHLIIAQYMTEFTDLDSLWFMVSPQNPFKRRDQLLSGEERLAMVEAAIEDNQSFAVSDLELHLEKPSYTYQTLLALADKFPNHTFTLIMGADNLTSLPRWKNQQFIIDNYEIYVYPRPGEQAAHVAKQIGANIQMIDAPLIDISSTHIREMIANGKTPRYWVPDKVLEIIYREGYYKEGVV